MNRNDKIKLILTASVIAALLLLLIAVIAFDPNIRRDGYVGEDALTAERLEDDAEDTDAETAAGTDRTASADTDRTTGGTASTGASAPHTANTVSGNARTASGKGASADTGNTAGGTASAGTSAPHTANTVSGNSLYHSDGAVLKNIYTYVRYDQDAQLKELADYWAAGNMDAVRDLVHLERFEAMSYRLKEGERLYYGETDADGQPHGQGLAVYANDRYYYGGWSHGVRSGHGAWHQFFPDYSRYVVNEHLYVGEFANGLPDGEGQEHYDYDVDLMDGVSFYPQNIIGNFRDGYYNGEMYVITQNEDGRTDEWYGTCEMGVWVKLGRPDRSGAYPVLYHAQKDETYIRMPDAENKNYRVENL